MSQPPPADLGFVHVFKPAARPNLPTLLLLHGTGGDEHDMVPLGGLLPGAALLSPRGAVLENGMPRFFRRLAEGVFDTEDVARRAGELADFVGAAATAYAFDPHRVVALGYSNGANVASAVMLLRPGVIAGAVLLRAMVPIVPDTTQPDTLTGVKVAISNGESDPIVTADETARLARLLQARGAGVEVYWQDAGHQLMPGDFNTARAFLAGL
jgi:predicted esterase